MADSGTQSIGSGRTLPRAALVFLAVNVPLAVLGVYPLGFAWDFLDDFVLPSLGWSNPPAYDTDDGPAGTVLLLVLVTLPYLAVTSITNVLAAKRMSVRNAWWWLTGLLLLPLPTVWLAHIHRLN